MGLWELRTDTQYSPPLHTAAPSLVWGLLPLDTIVAQAPSQERDLRTPSSSQWPEFTYPLLKSLPKHGRFLLGPPAEIPSSKLGGLLLP
jgi:hypothetical protein